MRLAFTAAVVGILMVALAPGAARGGESFPYKAYITADEVYVRSGPGQSYYPTDKLNLGEVVEVYRHDPGGWYAIRPPKGSYAWVSGRYVEPKEDGLGVVTGDRVAARVGSTFSDIRDVIQVRLHRGEVLEILEAKEFGAGGGSGVWYKIAPPSGEFRWVSGKFVDPDYPQDGVRETGSEFSPVTHPSGTTRARPEANGPAPADESPATDDAAATDTRAPARLESRPAEEPDDRVEPAEFRETDSTERASATEEDPGPDRPPAFQEAGDGRTPSPQHYTNEFDHPALDPNGSPTPRRISPDEFQKELDAIGLELSIMLAEEPTVWEFNELELRARTLLTQAETALERGKARLVAEKIARSADIKDRYAAINRRHDETVREDRQIDAIGRAKRLEDRLAERESVSRFDGEGRLARVVSPQVGTPRYALVDEDGEPVCYVTPAPGVNLNAYLKKRIGINGTRGYIAEKDAPHVMAKHVTPLDGAVR